MAKKKNGKRKSRTELYKLRAAKLKSTYSFVSRLPSIVSGGNPFGLGEYTLRVSAGPAPA